MRPIAVTVDNSGFIYIVDDLNRRISIFRPNGTVYNVFGFHYYGFAHESIAVNSTGHVLLSHVLFGEQQVSTVPLITEYDTNGKVVREYGLQRILMKQDNYGLPVNGSYGFYLDDSGTLYIKSTYPYTIQVFKDGLIWRVIHRNTQIFTKPEIVQTTFTPTEGPGAKTAGIKKRSGVLRILPLPDGRLVTIIQDYGKDYKENNELQNFVTHIELFDQDGHFLKRYPGIGKRTGFSFMLIMRGISIQIMEIQMM